MKKSLLSLAVTLFLVGAGCSVQNSQSPDVSLPQNTANPTAASATTKTITVGGVITLEIPSQCNASVGAGSTYITCPTPDNETPTPELVISSDGNQVNVKRWEGLESPYWNDIVSSIKIKTPLAGDIQINVEK